MNCKDIDEWLMTTGGEAMPAEVAEHLKTCASCRQLVAATLPGEAAAPLAPDLSASIRNLIAKETKSVRPLPRSFTLSVIFFVTCALVGVVGGIAVVPKGFPLLTATQRISIFGILAALAVAAACMASRGMRPASGRLHGGMLATLSLLLPEVVFFLVFRDYDASNFVPAGLVCLALGLAFAVPTGFLAWLLMKRGLVVEPLAAGALCGLIGGLAGLGMLEVHCPLLTVPHVGLWHMAVVLISLAAGAMWGRREEFQGR